MPPAPTPEKNANRRQVLEAWICPDRQSFYCHFDDHNRRYCCPDPHATAKSAAYYPLCVNDKEYNCLFEDYRTSMAARQVA